VQDDEGSLDALLWSFVDGQPKENRYRKLGDIPAETAESSAMSKELKRRGFRFVGPTVCYAFMQACGLVNDHVTSCFRYGEVMRPSADWCPRRDVPHLPLRTSGQLPRG
jgi:DNA-3-methyladenine glycosylase I